MTYQNRIAHLEEQHHQLDKQIDQLERNGVFDDVEITEMKKKRLHIRDELVTLEARRMIDDNDSNLLKSVIQK